MNESGIVDKFNIIKTLPYLKTDHDKRHLLLEKLASLGVDEQEDLVELKLENISPPLSYVKAKRLITQWNKDFFIEKAVEEDKPDSSAIVQDSKKANNLNVQIIQSTERVIACENYYKNPPQPLTNEEDISKNLDTYCEELRQFLVKKGKSVCGIEQVFCVDRPVKAIAPLQISHSVGDVLYDEVGHYHHREEITSLLVKPPKSDITVEELFVKAYEHAVESTSLNISMTEEYNMRQIDANGNIVAVVGQAGIGKTTLTKVLLNRVLSEERLYDSDFCFHLQFRDHVYDQETDLLSFLAKGFNAQWMNDKSNRNAVLNRLAQSKVVIIMDGFDEVNLKADDQSIRILSHNDNSTGEDFIWNIFQGHIFPKAKKLITSRPRQLFQLSKELRPQFIVNILGLDTKAQKAICEDLCGTNGDVVFEYTQDHPDISSYCYVPLNCILVMHCINHLSQVSKSKCHMPITLTGIFVVVLCLFIDSLQVRKHFNFKLKSLKAQAELAWNGFMNNRYYFNELDLKQAGFKHEHLNTFFITVLGKNKLSFFNGLSPQHTYFSHLLWQEFFVAIKLMFFVTPDYIRTIFFAKTDSDPSKQVKFDFTHSRFEMVTKFMYGMCNVTTYEYLREQFQDLPQFPSVQAKLLKDMALQNLPKLISNQTFQNFLQTCSWVNEMHDEVFTKVIAEKVSKDITVHRVQILPSDIAGFHYMLRARKQPISINFGYDKYSLRARFQRKPLFSTINCNASQKFNERMPFYSKLGVPFLAPLFPGDGLIRFFKEMHGTVQSSSVTIKRIQLGGDMVGDEAIGHISNCISVIEELELSPSRITTEGLKVLTSKIQHLTKPMKLLDLSRNSIGDEGAYCLSTCLCKIKELILSDCRMTSKGIQSLVPKIQHLTEPMNQLDLSRNGIKDEGVNHLSTCLSNIEELILSGCGITIIGIQNLVLKIQHLTEPMRKLDVSFNQTGLHGFIAISQRINKIEKLSIGYTLPGFLTITGIKRLSAAIQLRRTKMMEELSVYVPNELVHEVEKELASIPFHKVKELILNDSPILPSTRRFSPHLPVSWSFQSNALHY